MAKLAVALVAAAILLMCLSRVSAHKTHNVTFYVHDSILVPNAKALIVAGPGGDLTKLQKGAILVVDTVITKTADPNSASLGKFEGQYIVDGGIKYRIQATVIIDFPGDLVETTYEILGQRTSFNSTDDRTLAVVAGTGFFEGQKGYAVVHTVAQQLFGTNGAQINTQKWTLVVGK
ncbi:hypothetical protein BDL97_04G017300 [Sphagnum fallax]|jgi:hypothetical protein|nr:hypothetical protein BDL97_04G017300 [Sphagnum fallax]